MPIPSRLRAAAFLALAASSAPLHPAGALDASAERGRAFVERNCSRCHATGESGASPLPIAPAFRTLHRRYPIENLAEAFAEGVVTGHPGMPEFRLEPGQIEDLLTYLNTLKG